MTEVRWWGVALLAVVFVVTLFGKKISRTLELWNGFMVLFIIVSLLFFVLAFVPFSKWVSGFASLVTPAMPPKGSDEVAWRAGGLHSHRSRAELVYPRVLP
jgi:Mn2+/Fe2+ NRAMP family transporter